MSRIPIVRTLRSRRLAVGLIVALVAYAIAATFVPQDSAGEDSVRRWAAEHPVAESIASATGFHRAFSTPVFLALALLLALATGACAWERTGRARALSRRLRAMPAGLKERLKERSHPSVAIPPDMASAAVLQRIERDLAAAGLRVTREADGVSASAGRLGLWGSPVFHWALVALMLVVGLGRATRAEGFMALPLGQRVADRHEGYAQIAEGPLFGERHTGIELVASELDRGYVNRGIEYGPTPFVTAYRFGSPVASGWVRPNHALRVGRLMVHMADFGPAVTLALESSTGAETSRATITLDRSAETSSGSAPQEFELAGAGGAEAIRARIQVVTFHASEVGADGRVSRALIETATVGSADFGPAVVVPEGEAIDLPGGQRLRVAGVTDWVRVSVANDWSVPFIYVLLALAVAALAAAVLLPARRAIVVLAEDGTGSTLYLTTWHARKDPTFTTQVVAIVSDAAESEEGP